MCEVCAEAARRKRLSEIDSQWHCTIIGTCLSMGELRNLAVKIGLEGARSRSDYVLHSNMVHLAGADAKVSKIIGKALDRKHAAWLSRVRRLTGAEQLLDAWGEALQTGEVSGACWALLSHPAATAEVRQRIFGDIHMLSHQVGSAARADLKHIHRIENEKAALEARLAAMQDRFHQEMKLRTRDRHELRVQLEQERAETRRLAFAAEGRSRIDGLTALVEELRSHLGIEEARRTQAEERFAAQAAHGARLEEELRCLGDEAAELRQELAALERRLGGDGLSSTCLETCPGKGLCGKCVLYVGGRAGAAPHLKALVESHQGAFLHHDGGWEDGDGRLPALIGRADLVLLPVDCVSHAAHDQVKRLCRRWEKPFVPMRSSGLGTLARTLSALAEA